TNVPPGLTQRTESPMPEAEQTPTTPAPDDSAPDDTMEEWEIGDVEPVLLNLKAEIAIRGHLINTPDDVESDTWARLEDALIASHAALIERWHGAWRFEISERKTAMEALKAAKAERDAPGSAGDVEQAESCWRLLRSAGKVVLDMCEERDLAPPAQVTDADVELIGLCDRLVEINGEEAALFARIKDDDERAPVIPPLYEQHEEIRARLFEIGRPVTGAGAEAVARAAWVSGDL